METTFEPSFPALRSKIIVIEAMELSVIGFLLWGLIALLSIQTPNTRLLDLLLFLVITEVVLLGSWIIYNVYIRIARLGGRFVDVGIWIIASLATGTYTFWAWTILDINRWIVSKLFYRGKAPIEYAWSWRSKQVHKFWEQAQKASV
ncbi:MAG TPA: hypothetical protein VK909_11355 [Anaerolineales bacterium]|jgi:hypothetical protein|nr:hypothetical protein [Anaerolineales bacterium]